MILKKKISDVEIRQIAKLHYDLLGDGFLASFGEDFLYLVYQKINLTVGSTIIVYCAESRVVGFVAGGNGLKNIYLQLLKHPVQISKCVMPKLLQMSTAVKLYSLFTRKMGKNIIANKKINSELTTKINGSRLLNIQVLLIIESMLLNSKPMPPNR